MDRLNKYFKRSEFACHCGCGFSAVDVELLTVLTEIREELNTPVVIISGCRCESHNEAVGGAKHSKHVKAIAADIKIPKHDPIDIYNYLNRKYPDKYGVGLYTSWVHIDVRPKIARWG